MEEKHRKCPKCGREMTFDEDICPFCGFEIQKIKSRILWIITAILVVSLIIVDKLPEISLFFWDRASVSSSEIQAGAEKPAQKNTHPWYKDLRSLAFWLPQHIDLSPDSEEMQEAQQQVSDLLHNYPSSRQELMDFLLNMDYVAEDIEVILNLFEEENDIDYAQQALLRARKTLEYGGYSAKDLKEVLLHNGFSQEEADYALEIVEPETDWDQQALQRTLQDMTYSHYSYLSLIEFLEHIGFSHESAVYAADNCEADWKEEALCRLKDYIKYGNAESTEELAQWLTYDQFTEEEIAYAIKAAGI